MVEKNGETQIRISPNLMGRPVYVTKDTQKRGCNKNGVIIRIAPHSVGVELSDGNVVHAWYANIRFTDTEALSDEKK
jgi:hypothetical protein